MPSRRRPAPARFGLWASVLAAGLTSLPRDAAACPAFVRGEALAPFPPTPRGQVGLFALAPQDAGGTAWRRLPLQVDPLGADGLLLTLAPGQDPKTLPLGPHDRLVFDVSGFGPAWTGQEPPCPDATAHEISDGASPGRFAYLVTCPAGLPPATPNDAGRVTHDATRHRIGSPIYDYEYLPNNQLMYRGLWVKDPERATPWEAGKDSDILLHLDVKSFFNLDFTNDDVRSYVEATQMGDLGLVGRIQFYLKVLFFKIDLKMATLASWFADSANIPMLVDVPMDAPPRLNAGSGMLFTWVPKDARFLPFDAGARIPTADPMAIKAGVAHWSRAGLPACGPDGQCRFSLPGRVGSRDFSIEMNVGRELVEKGFFPAWVGDVAAFRDSMGWGGKKDAPSAERRTALYFENAGLPKGRYRMDFWIKLDGAAGARSACPHPVTVAARTSASPSP